MKYESDKEQQAEKTAGSESGLEANHVPAIIFAIYSESDEALFHARLLAESIRTFAGKYKDSPVWVYIPENLQGRTDETINEMQKLGVEIRTSRTPDDAQWFYYAGKVFAAGKAEAAAEGKAAVLVWMDEDTIVLREPIDFALNKAIGFAYRPVMHNRSGSLYAKPPDPFWSRIYGKLTLDPDSLFAMVTPADRQTIRAYFNAGLLVVRPGRKILRNWGEQFKILYRDSVLAEMCRENVTYRIFLHQTALVGAVMHTLEKDAMVELSDRYNYPIFFKKMYGAESEFDSIEDVVTLRYDIYFRKPDPDWSDQLIGPADKIAWMKQRLGGN
ncbi:MAG: hypothetical protein JSV44_02645 [Candidatus Zixiibacteriota bacterium]|nr:MAG: hypothetical protein JSV44_02645 [candidate division Zixibacteria bacterium]